ncbi:hypothetical protein WA158_000379 [Blastocystis sp. Blastoise]
MIFPSIYKQLSTLSKPLDLLYISHILYHCVTSSSFIFTKPVVSLLLSCIHNSIGFLNKDRLCYLSLLFLPFNNYLFCDISILNKILKDVLQFMNKYPTELYTNTILLMYLHNISLYIDINLNQNEFKIIINCFISLLPLSLDYPQYIHSLLFAFNSLMNKYMALTYLFSDYIDLYIDYLISIYSMYIPKDIEDINIYQVWSDPTLSSVYYSQHKNHNILFHSNPPFENTLVLASSLLLNHLPQERLYYYATTFNYIYIQLSTSISIYDIYIFLLQQSSTYQLLIDNGFITSLLNAYDKLYSNAPKSIQLFMIIALYIVVKHEFDLQIKDDINMKNKLNKEVLTLELPPSLNPIINYITPIITSIEQSSSLFIASLYLFNILANYKQCIIYLNPFLSFLIQQPLTQFSSTILNLCITITSLLLPFCPSFQCGSIFCDLLDIIICNPHYNTILSPLVSLIIHIGNNQPEIQSLAYCYIKDPFNSYLVDSISSYVTSFITPDVIPSLLQSVQITIPSFLQDYNLHTFMQILPPLLLSLLEDTPQNPYLPYINQTQLQLSLPNTENKNENNFINTLMDRNTLSPNKMNLKKISDDINQKKKSSISNINMSPSIIPSLSLSCSPLLKSSSMSTTTINISNNNNMSTTLNSSSLTINSSLNNIVHISILYFYYHLKDQGEPSDSFYNLFKYYSALIPNNNTFITLYIHVLKKLPISYIDEQLLSPLMYVYDEESLHLAVDYIKSIIISLKEKCVSIIELPFFIFFINQLKVFVSNHNNDILYWYLSLFNILIRYPISHSFIIQHNIHKSFLYLFDCSTPFSILQSTCLMFCSLFSTHQKEIKSVLPIKFMLSLLQHLQNPPPAYIELLSFLSYNKEEEKKKKKNKIDDNMCNNDNKNNKNNNEFVSQTVINSPSTVPIVLSSKDSSIPSSSPSMSPLSKASNSNKQNKIIQNMDNQSHTSNKNNEDYNINNNENNEIINEHIVMNNTDTNEISDNKENISDNNKENISDNNKENISNNNKENISDNKENISDDKENISDNNKENISDNNNNKMSSLSQDENSLLSVQTVDAFNKIFYNLKPCINPEENHSQTFLSSICLLIQKGCDNRLLDYYDQYFDSLLLDINQNIEELIRLVFISSYIYHYSCVTPTSERLLSFYTHLYTLCLSLNTFTIIHYQIYISSLCRIPISSYISLYTDKHIILLASISLHIPPSYSCISNVLQLNIVVLSLPSTVQIYIQDLFPLFINYLSDVPDEVLNINIQLFIQYLCTIPPCPELLPPSIYTIIGSILLAYHNNLFNEEILISLLKLLAEIQKKWKPIENDIIDIDFPVDMFELNATQFEQIDDPWDRIPYNKTLFLSLLSFIVPDIFSQMASKIQITILSLIDTLLTRKECVSLWLYYNANNILYSILSCCVLTQDILDYSLSIITHIVQYSHAAKSFVGSPILKYIFSIISSYHESSGVIYRFFLLLKIICSFSYIPNIFITLLHDNNDKLKSLADQYTSSPYIQDYYNTIIKRKEENQGKICDIYNLLQDGYQRQSQLCAVLRDIVDIYTHSTKENVLKQQNSKIKELLYTIISLYNNKEDDDYKVKNHINDDMNKSSTPSMTEAFSSPYVVTSTDEFGQEEEIMMLSPKNEVIINCYQILDCIERICNEHIQLRDDEKLSSIYNSLFTYKNSVTTVKYATTCLLSYPSPFLENQSLSLYQIISLFIELAKIYCHQEDILYRLSLLFLRLIPIPMTSLLLSSPLYLTRLTSIICDDNFTHSSSIQYLYTRLIYFAIRKPSQISTYIPIYTDIFNQVIIFIQRQTTSRDLILICFKIITVLYPFCSMPSLPSLLVTCIFANKGDEEVEENALVLLKSILEHNDISILREKIKNILENNDILTKEIHHKLKIYMISLSLCIQMDKMKNSSLFNDIFDIYMEQYVKYPEIEEGFSLSYILRKCIQLDVLDYENIYYKYSNFFIELLQDISTSPYDELKQNKYESFLYIIRETINSPFFEAKVNTMILSSLPNLIQIFWTHTSLLIPLISIYTRLLNSNQYTIISSKLGFNETLLYIYSASNKLTYSTFLISCLTSIYNLLKKEGSIQYFLNHEGMDLIKKSLQQISLSHNQNTFIFSASTLPLILKILILLCNNDQGRFEVRDLIITTLYTYINENRDRSEVMYLFYKLLLMFKKYMNMNEWTSFYETEQIKSILESVKDLYSNSEIANKFNTISTIKKETVDNSVNTGIASHDEFTEEEETEKEEETVDIYVLLEQYKNMFLKDTIEFEEIAEKETIIFSLIRTLQCEDISETLISSLQKYNVISYFLKILTLPSELDCVPMLQAIIYLLSSFALHPTLKKIITAGGAVPSLIHIIPNDIKALQSTSGNTLIIPISYIYLNIYCLYALANIVFENETASSEFEHSGVLNKFISFYTSCINYYIRFPSEDIQKLIDCILSLCLNLMYNNKTRKQKIYMLGVADTVFSSTMHLNIPKITLLILKIMSDLSNEDDISKDFYERNIFELLNDTVTTAVSKENIDIIKQVLYIYSNLSLFCKFSEERETILLNTLYNVLSHFNYQCTIVLQVLYILNNSYYNHITPIFLQYNFLNHIPILLRMYPMDVEITCICLNIIEIYINNDISQVPKDIHKELFSALNRHKKNKEMVKRILSFFLCSTKKLDVNIDTISEGIDFIMDIIQYNIDDILIYKDCIVLLRYYIQNKKNLSEYVNKYHSVLLHLMHTQSLESGYLTTYFAFIKSIITTTTLPVLINSIQIYIQIYANSIEDPDVVTSLLRIFVKVIQLSDRAARNSLRESTLLVLMNKTLVIYEKPKEIQSLCNTIITLLE